MRRLVPWIGAFLVATLVGAGAVVALNATAFGPGAFVRIYLDALARGDAASALALPGVTADGDTQLLRDDVLTGLGDLRQVRDEPLGDDRHRITMSWTAPGGSGTTDFEVERVGTRLGLFPEWGFAVSPVATLALDLRGDARFTANGVDGSTGRVTAGVAELAVLVPGGYRLEHETEFLRADPVTVLADTPGGVVDAVVEVEPGPAFAGALADAVERHLAACTEQEVLFPTGCPFGKAVSDRLASAPVWSIAHLPEFAADAVDAGEFGTWIVGPEPGTAHLTVDVQSLFDGSIDELDEDVPFQARYSVRVDGGALRVTSLDPEGD